MNNVVDLKKIAEEILEINRIVDIFGTYLNHKWDFDMFEQVWGNTSGGFEGIGGSAMTKQRTYILYNDKEIYVFFGGEFAYKTEMNDKIRTDIKNKNIAGKISYLRKYKI